MSEASKTVFSKRPNFAAVVAQNHSDCHCVGCCQINPNRVPPKMLLYHFTCVQGCVGILRSGAILRGKSVVGREPAIGFAVCLTVDPDGNGHGLPDGREVQPEDDQSQIVRVVDGKKYSRDKLAIRLKIEIDETDPLLRPVTAFVDAKMLNAMELTANFPLTSTVSTENLVLADGDPKTFRKGNTWWYYLDSIHVSLITAIEFKNPDRTYSIGR